MLNFSDDWVGEFFFGLRGTGFCCLKTDHWGWNLYWFSHFFDWKQNCSLNIAHCLPVSRKYWDSTVSKILDGYCERKIFHCTCCCSSFYGNKQFQRTASDANNCSDIFLFLFAVVVVVVPTVCRTIGPASVSDWFSSDPSRPSRDGVWAHWLVSLPEVMFWTEKNYSDCGSCTMFEVTCSR